MNRYSLPSSWAGARIGLLGGSFDPAHAGHLHLSTEALKRLNLDQLWWLVSPGNPLKDRGPAVLSQRMDHANQIAQHPRIKVTDIETQLGTQYTIDTLRRLQMVYPHTDFVWIMGADNLGQIHRWKDWREIFHRMPIATFARPGDRMAALTSPAARQFRRYRCDMAALMTLGHPAWAFANIPMRDISSTAIRAQGRWL